MEQWMENAHYEEFEQRVLREARKQAEEMLQTARESTEAAIKQEGEGLEETMQAFGEENKKRMLQILSRGKMENRRSLLEKRAALQQTLFGAVLKRLETFCQSPDYPAFLIKKLEKYPDMTQRGGCICLSPRDMIFSGEIKKAFSGCRVREDANILLGGFKLQAGAVMQNETFDAAIRAEQEAFAADSGLFF